jgi:hypothetical protein
MTGKIVPSHRDVRKLQNSHFYQTLFFNYSWYVWHVCLHFTYRLLVSPISVCSLICLPASKPNIFFPNKIQ